MDQAIKLRRQLGIAVDNDFSQFYVYNVWLSGSGGRMAIGEAAPCCPNCNYLLKGAWGLAGRIAHLRDPQ